MAYINILTNTYPVLEDEIKRKYPNVSFAIPFVSPSEYKWVFPTPQPTFDPLTQTVKESAPAITNKNTWEQQWQVEQLPQDVIDSNIARKKQEIQDSFTAQTQTRLDTFAKTRGYDSILSLCTYATDTTVQFQIEGQYGVQVRSQTWQKLYEILNEILSGVRPITTTYANIEAELPTLQWPQ